MSVVISQETLRKYQSKTATREVLGCLVRNPGLMRGHRILLDDFVEAFHKVVFVGINNCVNNNINKLDGQIIEDYLKEAFPTKHIIFSRNNGARYVDMAAEIATEENFEANYIELKKFSLLRRLLKEGNDVSDFFDPDELDAGEVEKKRELFESSSLDDIIDFYKKKLVTVADEYSSKNGRDSVKAGSSEAKEQKERWKKAPEFGLSYASQYFNTVVKGMRKKRFVIGSAQSGTGKTRLSVANLCFSFIPEFYDPKTDSWVKNPHGTQNAGLYIGTEMELIEEIEPILWAYIACVPEEHILNGEYRPGEEERVDRAIEILDKEAHIYLEYIPDYDISTLERVVEEHVLNHKVRHVFFDYIHTTTDLISEFQGEARAKMQVREDQVLSNLSTKLKELTRKFNISLDTWTQVNGELKNDQTRDENVVRGSRAIIDKVDTAFIASRPTPREYKLIDKYIKRMMGKQPPNLCFSVYKNRGGKYNRIKIWLYVDYDTMRVHDCFVTDYDYIIVPDISKTYVAVNEDVGVVTAVDKFDLERRLAESKAALNQVEDDGERISFEEEFGENIDKLSKNLQSESTTEEDESSSLDDGWDLPESPREGKAIKSGEEYRDEYLREATADTFVDNRGPRMAQVDEDFDF